MKKNIIFLTLILLFTAYLHAVTPPPSQETRDEKIERITTMLKEGMVYSKHELINQALEEFLTIQFSSNEEQLIAYFKILEKLST